MLCASRWCRRPASYQPIVAFLQRMEFGFKSSSRNVNKKFSVLNEFNKFQFQRWDGSEEEYKMKIINRTFGRSVLGYMIALVYLATASTVPAQSKLESVIKATQQEGALTVNAPSSLSASERVQFVLTFLKKYGLKIDVQIDLPEARWSGRSRRSPRKLPLV